MSFLRRHWYTVGLLIAGGALCAALVGNLPTVQLILLLNFIALLLHQFEEYAWPGGEPWITNDVMQPSDRPDRYPLNQNNALFINAVAAYLFYLVPVFFPQMVWMGLAPMLFGVGQLIVHGVITNLRLKGVYNPGLAAVALGHIPLAVWYLVEVYARGWIRGWDWIVAVIYLVSFIGIVMKWLGYTVLADKDSPYPFTPEEMARFSRDRRLAHIGRPAAPVTNAQGAA
jgi:hypothetical protein